MILLVATTTGVYAAPAAGRGDLGAPSRGRAPHRLASPRRRRRPGRP